MSAWLMLMPDRPPLSSAVSALAMPSCGSQFTIWSPAQNAVLRPAVRL
jgi:hypothetical protein